MRPAVALVGLLAIAAGFPPNARRTTPPPGLEERALKLGAAAPAISLPTSGGAPFVLADQLRRGPVALVFYRGSW